MTESLKAIEQIAKHIDAIDAIIRDAEFYVYEVKRIQSAACDFRADQLFTQLYQQLKEAASQGQSEVDLKHGLPENGFTALYNNVIERFRALGFDARGHSELDHISILL